MESGFEPGLGAGSLAYDGRAGLLLFLRDGERHEISIRAQAHRLVRYMVERNGAAAGAPALCTHAELMQAVWGDEPMHTREELAKLVWELRRKLEPFGAGGLIENERGLGYRLYASLLDDRAPASAAPVESPPPVPAAPRPSRRRRLLVLGIAAALAVGAATAAAFALTRGPAEQAAKPPGTSSPALRVFVDRVENILEQSAEGRREIRQTLTAGLRCAVTAPEAAQRIGSVADNRQSVLDQLGTLQAPTQQAADAVTFLQRALQASIEADRHYRDGFVAVRNARCPVPPNSDFRRAAASDAQATTAKQRFVAAFNPLARRFGRRTWSAAGF